MYRKKNFYIYAETDNLHKLQDEVRNVGVGNALFHCVRTVCLLLLASDMSY